MDIAIFNDSGAESVVNRWKHKHYGDCPTCIYTNCGPQYRSGHRLCTHPSGELYTIDGLVSKCDGWVERKGA